MEQDVQNERLNTPENGNSKSKKVKNEIWEWVKAIAIALVLVFIIRFFLFKPFIVDGPSMQPNFHTGERVIVNQILYDIREPERGEVVVFHVPSENRDFIKRVIAVEGDSVEVTGDTLKVNGEVVEEPYLQEAIAEAQANGGQYNTYNFPNEYFPDGTVPEGHIFALGDNRGNSTDSRMIGYVPLEDIVGRADVIFWPLKDIEWINH
ncbi:signal peptidase I [Paenibacillus sp. 453mf]|uniref:signal peptidase I n=1 Tax=Paenibacillus sp. 453mf TaxID=1761874 RepID=UPI0008E4722F|nr:signal peptidase I [Paenibacillus sp. 453mf]SFS47607.1 signal peptidase I [Paenibacillus sp. 453mf]